MNNKIILMAVMLLFLFTLESCHKSTSSSSAISINEYPVSVGDKWTYQVTDDLYSTMDTESIIVTDKRIYNTDSTVYKTQTILNGIVVDSSIIMESTTAYSYYSHSAYYALFENLKLKFPINQNSGWQGQNVSDSIYVLETNQIRNILGVTYSTVCEINRIQNMLDNNIISTIYVEPNVGIIYESINVNFGYPVKSQTIRLISYDLH